MRTVRYLCCLAATGLCLGALSLGCSGSGSSAKIDALSSGGGGQVGSTTNPGGTGAAGHSGGRNGGTGGTGGNNTAGSVMPPQDGGTGGAVDAARDGNRDGVNDAPAGSNDGGAVDGPFDASKNPDVTGDAARDRIPTADTRDGATDTRDASPDGNPSCGECLLGLTCGGGGVANQCGVTIAPQHGKNCTIAGWCSEADRPVGLNAVHATTKGDIWAVGNSGQIAHFDGSVWTITSGAIQSRGVVSSDLSTEGARNVAQFTDVWASGPSDVWVIAKAEVPAKTGGGIDAVSLVLRGDGIHWNTVLASATSTNSYVGIWGTGPDDVWVAQNTTRQSALSPYAFSVLHWNGGAWATLQPPDTSNAEMVNGIWGLAANDIYLVCQDHTWRFDGTTWTPITQSGTSIWGTSASSLWIAKSSKLLHGIGATWVEMKPPSGCGTGVWGASDSSVWFGGCYYDGLKWTLLFPGGIKAVQGPTATGALGLALADGSMVNLTPTSATDVSAGVPAMVYNDIAGSGPKDVWIVGAGAEAAARARAVHWDGSTPTIIDQPFVNAFTTVSVLPGNDVWAGSTFGLWRLSEGSFVASTSSPAGSRHRLWSPSKDAIWAVTGSDATIASFNGTTWQKLPHGLSASTVKLASVWGSGTTDIWVAGSGGITEHWDGNAWTAHDAGTTDLVRVWGASATQVFVAAQDDKVYGWDGSRWAVSPTTPLNRPGIVDYRACATNDVWASLTTRYSSNYYGTSILYTVPELGHFDGSSWHIYSLAELELSPGPARVWCAAPGDTWVVSGGTAVMRLQTP